MMATLSAYGHVLVGYGLTAGLLGAFTWRLMARGRRLARQVPDEEKPWI